MKKIVLLIFISVLFLVSCATNEEDNRLTSESSQDITKISSNTPIDQSFTNKVKEEVLNREDIKGVRGVNTKDELLLAIEVEEIKQFNEQDIEKEIKKTLEKKYPNKNFKISSDQKIFIELDDLEKKIQNNKVDKKELEKKYKNIKKLLDDPA
ncbi:YhcN/YlaJ family sporulation lipoprotein [Aquibacillus sediminis]|uniref:YhcN/YlaJ family sporulation lipoprotein n=1 Tax=Aquibacillus sediminis TaxID=2574734 RepID=UPI0014872707|nr:YhcN/YlaJ family sporulation lipoprotein [Aquibacillus sediminis]